MIDYDQVHHTISAYRAAYDASFTSVQRELAKECSQSILDLRALELRIRTQLDIVLGDSNPGPQDLRQLLTNDAQHHPDIARWLAENPNPVSRVVMRGYTTDGSAEALSGLETPQEQQLRLDTEAYYYKAHRLLTGLRLLPELSSTKCAEIRVIRNHLLEHPEKPASGIILPSFSYSANDGPIVKGTRYSHQSALHRDTGLFHNRDRLLQIVEHSLRGAIQKRPPRTESAAT